MLDGNSIYLRTVQKKDVTIRYLSWLNDPEVNQFLETRFTPQTIEGIEEYVNQVSYDKSTFFFAIFYKKTNEHIGNIKLGPINWIHKFAEISLFIGEKKYWNKRLATEAIKIISSFAFRKLNLHKLTAGAYANNLGSIKAFKNADFHEEAAFKKQYIFNGQYVNRVCLCLFSNFK